MDLSKASGIARREAFKKIRLVPLTIKICFLAILIISMAPEDAFFHTSKHKW
jgi:hypothetical protein